MPTRQARFLRRLTEGEGASTPDERGGARRVAIDHRDREEDCAEDEELRLLRFESSHPSLRSCLWRHFAGVGKNYAGAPFQSKTIVLQGLASGREFRSSRVEGPAPCLVPYFFRQLELNRVVVAV